MIRQRDKGIKSLMEPWDKGDETFEILLHCSDESGERDIWRTVDKARSCFHKCTKDLMGLLAQIALVLKHHLVKNECEKRRQSEAGGWWDKRSNGTNGQSA